MKTISFFIPTIPHGKATHRDKIIKPKDPSKPAFVKHYPEPKTRVREQHVSDAFLFEVGGGWQPITVGIVLRIEVYFPMLAGWGVKKRERMNLRPVLVKPDCSNVVKLIEDGLNGIAWTDDKLVTDLMCFKRYNYVPGYRVTIEWEDAP